MKSRFRFANHLSSTLTFVLVLGSIASTSMAHEPTQTHRRLAIAAFELFQANSDYDFLAEDGIEPIDVELELGLGVMEDDRCIETDDLGLPWYDFANFYNHFWDPASNTNSGAPFGGDTVRAQRTHVSFYS